MNTELHTFARLRAIRSAVWKMQDRVDELTLALCETVSKIENVVLRSVCMVLFGMTHVTLAVLMVATVEAAITFTEGCVVMGSIAIRVIKGHKKGSV